MSHPTGKVARLPKDIRIQVNRMLDDAITYDSIIAWLEREGHPGFNSENISNWYSGGYQDWRREQNRRDNVQLQREWTQEFLHYQEPEQIAQAASTLITTQLANALERFDLDKLTTLMADDPKTYFKVVSQFLQVNQQRAAEKRARALASNNSEQTLSDHPSTAGGSVAPRVALNQSKSNQIKADQSESN